MTKKIGVAGIGAIGSVVAQALLNNEINGFELDCICDPTPIIEIDRPNVSFLELVSRVDLIVECLPAAVVPELAEITFKVNKNILFISSAALLVYPEILERHKNSTSTIYVPSGALTGLDGVKAMKELGIRESKIATTKPPKGFIGAPHVIENNIDLEMISEKTCIFEGNALEASKGFPANINVAATLSLAGIGPQETRVEIWTDPEAKGNTHEITVKG
ncbi:MAG: DUF108 domain-containing protein, partial [Alphaproteobacteria bacterium]|nr:DUF108 domain-containing protein [Alphaproteobacteria bacterium]